MKYFGGECPVIVTGEVEEMVEIFSGCKKCGKTLCCMHNAKLHLVVPLAVACFSC